MPRASVNLALLIALIALAATGTVNLFANSQNLGWVYVLHRGAAVVLVPLLVWKLPVAARSLRRRGWSINVVPGLLLAGVVLSLVVTGTAWLTGLWSAWELAGNSLLGLHLDLFYALALPMSLHIAMRWERPRRATFRARRTLLRLAAAASAAVVGVAAFGVAAPWLHRMPSPRRFTGSFFAGGAGANDFPVTAFLADDPPPEDVASWRLHIGGRVVRPLTLTLEELTAGDRALVATSDAGAPRPTLWDGDVAPAGLVQTDVLRAFEQPGSAHGAVRAVIDCTGGWCADRVWAGMRLGSLLEAAGASSDATFVVVHSLTGYLTALPIAEARAALLATHVGGQPLAHGHGFPLRLVAPERRGFEWVKWVDEVHVV